MSVNVYRGQDRQTGGGSVVIIPCLVLFNVSCSHSLCLNEHGSRQSALWGFQQKLFLAPFSKIHNDPAMTHTHKKKVRHLN